MCVCGGGGYRNTEIKVPSTSVWVYIWVKRSLFLDVSTLVFRFTGRFTSPVAPPFEEFGENFLHSFFDFIFTLRPLSNDEPRLIVGMNPMLYNHTFILLRLPITTKINVYTLLDSCYSSL